MAIISFDKDTVIDYIPAYGGNRESDNPCIIRLKFLPFAKVQHYDGLKAARLKGIGAPGKIQEITFEIVKKQFVENVESVSGYFVGIKEVTDPTEFYDSADVFLIAEIVDAMPSIQKLTEGQRKN